MDECWALLNKGMVLILKMRPPFRQLESSKDHILTKVITRHREHSH